MTDIVIRLRDDAQHHIEVAHDCDCAPNDTVNFKHAVNAHEAANEIEMLREQVAHLSLYKPARRTEQKQEPVKAIGPCNFAFYGIVETDEEFAERAGTQVKEVEE